MSTAAAPQPFHPFNDFHRQHTNNPLYSPLSSGLPSPSFPPSIPLPPTTTTSTRGRSPTPASSRHPSRQVSVRRLSSIAPSRQPSSARPDLLPPHEILIEGDIIGQGLNFHGEPISVVHIPSSASRYPEPPPASHFQVLRKLGSGSYAVVYLVREILDFLDHPHAHSTSDNPSNSASTRNTQRRPYRYGREFAVKCLSKVNLSPEELEVQLFEATLHQSMLPHQNIATLYRTLQTSSYLLLLLESVPGQDLFYFLEQSREQIDPVNRQNPYGNDILFASPFTSTTPPTPSLLSTLHPTHLLSLQRLKLITSMFGQMCEAVAACHAQGVSHRDIKPENFIVTEGWRMIASPTSYLGSERRVMVKLTDFGLATLQMESADVDCGSAPYMSYECRNNVAPTYSTQPADVWSLGVVLINMLYHHNPWSDTAFVQDPITRRTTFICPSFADFLASPVQFFLQRFPGMTLPVAEFLANKVFCLLPPNAVDRRASAREFGEWAKGLPAMMAQPGVSSPASELLSPAWPTSPQLQHPSSGFVSHSMVFAPSPALSSTFSPSLPPSQPWSPVINDRGFSALSLSLSPSHSPRPPMPSLPASSSRRTSLVLSPSIAEEEGSHPLPQSSSLLGVVARSGSVSGSPGLPVAMLPLASPARLSIALPHPPMSPVPETEAVLTHPQNPSAAAATAPSGTTYPPSEGSVEGDGEASRDADGAAGKGGSGDDGVSFRSVSTKRRGKRGARKKVQQSKQNEEEMQQKLDYLADTLEQRAREISRTSSSVNVSNSSPESGLPNSASSASSSFSKLQTSPTPSRLSLHSSTTASTKRSTSSAVERAERALAKMPPPPSAPPPPPPIPTSLALATYARSMNLTEERERAQRHRHSRSSGTPSLASKSSSASIGSVIPPSPAGPPPLPPPANATPSLKSNLSSTLSPLSQNVVSAEALDEEDEREKESPVEKQQIDDLALPSTQPAASVSSTSIPSVNSGSTTTPATTTSGPAPTTSSPVPTVAKKSWKGMFGSFGSNSSGSGEGNRTPAPPAVIPPGLMTTHLNLQMQAFQSQQQKRAKAALKNADNNANGKPGDAAMHASRVISDLEPARPVPKAVSALKEASERGRKERQYIAPSPFKNGAVGAGAATLSRWPDRSPTRSSDSANWRSFAVTGPPQQAPYSLPSSASSPSVISGASSIRSAADTVASSDSSMSSFRLSNSSRASVSTVATSVSGMSIAPSAGMMKFGAGRGGAGSMYSERLGDDEAPVLWRAVDRDRPDGVDPPPRPRHVPVGRGNNVKRMEGIPWALNELPRQYRPPVDKKGQRQGSPPGRGKLDTITEQRPAPAYRRPTSDNKETGAETASVTSSRSTLSAQLAGNEFPGKENSSTESANLSGKKVVQKGQINALAKMLGSFKAKGRD